MKTETLARIKALRYEAANFESFHANYKAKYAPDAHCDKKGYGFGADSRFSGFRIETHFASWRGYYGNSSCSNIFSVHNEELARPFFIAALNEHQELIFATVARLMRKEAASLTEKATAEIEALQQMLTDASEEARAA